ncbi:putative transcriptional regulator [Candidatus Methanoperedens nitroreducens]|uniref:Putative HTH-type transcriptional regulatory protein ANME2D_03287 n=1 Tax=Candidatus Methanoperedens nitratireducens TaxID=1392998 RepID=A0A062UYX9_9EURY|nr:transcriptional regulator [Candidatus Methanoperedens nitroreducens]KCZ70372.1 putative transcriptional regulator [Candidatus Methanoperedens nitroreducens]MDJ1420812.1 transcriptional regulator [Candidatus Methanoperedens sp.]
MNKELLINRVISILISAGFVISARCDIRPRSFDLAARRGDLLLLIKVLYNIDGLNDETARGMLFLSKHLNGNPIIVGEKTRDHSLETGVVYFRYGVPSIDISTLNDYFIEDSPPLIYAEHGGLYVNIDGTALREERIRKNISLGALASSLGVSRRTVSKYEEGEMAASVDVAIRLEEIMDRGFIAAVELFERCYTSDARRQEHIEKKSLDILSILKDMGFDVLPISHAPFDAVSISADRRDENATILTGVGEYTSTIVKKAHLMSSISEVTLTQSLLIIHGASKAKNIERTVLIEDKELKNFSDKDDFIDLLQKRGRKIEVT